jgi:DNA repair exonuclease SbcCD ATPase subunit
VIRRLRLHGWRSFEEQSLDIGPGLTFVVAENGVGKTSLIDATAWAVYGSLSGVDAASARRIGAAETRVEVDIELPGGPILQISRVASARGKTAVAAAVGGEAVNPDDLPGLLAKSYGASAEFLARTTILPSHAVADETVGVFFLHEHLCRVLGVEDLQRVASELDALHDAAEAEAKTFRTAARRATADLAALHDELTQAERQLSALQEVQTALREELDEAEDQLRQAHRHAEAAQRAAAARAAFRDAVAASQAVLATPATSQDPQTVDNLVALLEQSERTAATAVDDVRRNLAVVAGRLESITTAAADLDTASGDCPVCRRPLSGEDLAHARRSHQADLAALHDREATLHADLKGATRHLEAVRAVLRQALAIPRTDDDLPANGGADADATQAAVNVVRQRFDEASAEVLAARTARTSLEQRIGAERAAASNRQASLLAHRRAAVSRMAATVARATANQMLVERIDPLAAEVRSRWKRVFGERGALQLGADGRLTLRRGVDDIPFEYLSSGEKVVALLAVRLLVLGSSTRASFLWLDEPLEHLDPRNRRLAASLMSAVGEHVHQILVTTYEEDLARRLARQGQATLLRVRSADVAWPPSA